MGPLLLSLAIPLLAQTPQAPPPDKPSTPSQPLSFFSQRFTYAWDQLLPLKVDVDGIRVTSIFFSRKEGPMAILKPGTARAQLEVTHHGTKPRAIGFAVAVFDDRDRLLGVASGGTRLISMKPGSTNTYDLSFDQVTERLPLGSSFVLSMELGE